MEDVMRNKNFNNNRTLSNDRSSSSDSSAFDKNVRIGATVTAIIGVLVLVVSAVGFINNNNPSTSFSYTLPSNTKDTNGDTSDFANSHSITIKGNGNVKTTKFTLMGVWSECDLHVEYNGARGYYPAGEYSMIEYRKPFHKNTDNIVRISRLKKDENKPCFVKGELWPLETQERSPFNHLPLESDNYASGFMKTILTNPYYPPGKPVPFWLTSDNKNELQNYLIRANITNKRPFITLYGIEGLDCTSSESSGIKNNEYSKITNDTASKIAALNGIVVIEPDATSYLANPSECKSNLPQQENTLKQVIKTLADAGVWVYVDAGHDEWIKPDVMSKKLLELTSMGNIAGISVNVANYRTNDQVTPYALDVLERIDPKRQHNLAFIIDTSRNGTKINLDNKPYNRTDARIGEYEHIVSERNHGGLWIKPPGESDKLTDTFPKAGEFSNKYYEILTQEYKDTTPLTTND